MTAQRTPGGITFTQVGAATLRRTYRLGDGTPTLTTLLAQTFAPRLVHVVVTADRHPATLAVTIEGRRVRATRTGLAETDETIGNSYVTQVSPVDQFPIWDLPRWVEPIVEDARARAAEAWA